MSAATLYDRIAAIYDQDMGRNMRHDDLRFYAGIATQGDGPALELGVGTGRVARALSAAGVAVVGVDRSRPMLAALRASWPATLALPTLLQGDLRALPLQPGRFATVLFPYSVLCYLASETEVQQALRSAVEVARPGARLVLDAFIPRPLASDAGFRPDYQRQTPLGQLSRQRRITALDDGRHRIERHYRLEATDGRCRTIETSALIRPLSPEALSRAAIQAGCRIESRHWDYGAADRAADAQFFSVIARTPGPAAP
jgi:SAM-dependent methyltransferase